MLKKIKSRADIGSWQNWPTLQFIQRRILQNKKKYLLWRTFVTAPTFVSLSYHEGEIIHIYHNQNLTSAFPTCLVLPTSLYSKTLEISHCSYQIYLPRKYIQKGNFPTLLGGSPNFRNWKRKSLSRKIRKLTPFCLQMYIVKSFNFAVWSASLILVSR